MFLLAGVAVLIGNRASAATLCVNQNPKSACYASIGSAVAGAAKGDTIQVGPGTYRRRYRNPAFPARCWAAQSTIDAASQPNGVLIDGFHHPGLHNVVVAGFTVKGALYEGILAVSTADITIHGNDLIDNDAIGPVFNPSAANCLGQPAYETDETGDCGGAVHLIGVSYSTVSGNLMTGNVDGVLISDETAISQGNLITQNSVVNYPLECDIVLASSPRRVLRPHYAPNMGSSTIRSPITSPPATASKLAVPA